MASRFVCQREPFLTLTVFSCPPPPQGRCAWESDSGRHMTLVDTEITELSRVEVQALQRIAVTQLQGMDVPVSHGMLKGASSGGDSESGRVGHESGVGGVCTLQRVT